MGSPTDSAAFLAQDTGGTLKAVMWVMASFAFIFVVLRVYVMIWIRRAFGWDTAIVIAAEACLIGYAAVSTAAANLGLGKHIEVVAQVPQHAVDVALLCDVAEALAIMACTLGKTSFAVMLLRIVVSRSMRAVLWFIIVTMNLVNVLAALFIFVQCKDPRHLWNPEIPSECWPSYVFTDFSLFVGAYSGAQDFVLALIPWAFLWKLQMKRKEKIGVAFAMSLGIFAGATAIVKVTYLPNLSKKSDYTYALPPLLEWAAVEDGLAIIASSIPTLRPLLKQVFPGSTNDATDYKDRSYPLKAASNNNNMFSPPNQGSNIASAAYWTPKHENGSKDHDDKSDRSILGRGVDDGNWHSQKIMKTREVAVTYNDDV